MSSILWDDQQMVGLLAWLETNVTLVQGDLVVESKDIPPEAFAASVSLEKKELSVLANPDNSMIDATTNIFLGYIIALAYDRTGWKEVVPSLDDLLDCHRLVCEAMEPFNEDFADHIEDLSSILENWREAHMEEYSAQEDSTATTSGSRNTDSLVESLGNRLFSNSQDKWRLN